jgi:transcriptional regulator with GAF, ATPase, and Fis domain
MAVQDLIERTRREIKERLAQIEPLVKERDRLRDALAALGGEKAAEKPRATRAKRQRGRPTTRRRAGRGERRKQLLDVLQAEPGLRPSEAARRMGIHPSQLHALAKRTEEEGALERRDGMLYPAAASDASKETRSAA